jgi:flavin-dependent dehydrogenase
MMLHEAVRRGAQLLRGKALKPLVRDDGSVGGVLAHLDGLDEVIESEVLLDCSGQATFLANAGGVTGPKYLGNYDKQIAIFSQVAGAIRDQGDTRDTHPDNTIIFYQQKYHWAWFIPLDRQVVSVGVVVPAQYFLDRQETKRDFLVRELHELNPELKRRLPEIELVEDVHVIPNYSYQVRRFSGPGFACVGDSHRFVDPIFSFGATVAMREGQLLAPRVRAYLAGEGRGDANPFADHQLLCEKGADVLEDMIDLFWEKPLAFAMFVHHRYKDEMTDLFATRMYERVATESTLTARGMLNRQEERESSYEHADSYSIPIGSRFHPERAPLWEPGSPIESTEEWMGPR